MRSWLLSAALLAGLLAPSDGRAQAPPQPAAEKTEKSTSEPKAPERDGSSALVYYTLSAIGGIVVLVLVCMPARRE